ncbi:MAG: Zn-dependent alcohol dehydrogenase [Deltaproteobacteria bacterium]|nr:Zn-dependent alcohol dehydrogenase [Deltaproteobacteria bacterium]
MKAVICYERDKPVVVEEIEHDAPGRDEVCVRMAASGVCHSDLSVVTGVMPLMLPCVLGHEGAGVVEEVGEGVTHVKPGDRVVFSWVATCGTCYFCRIGKQNLCELGEKVNRMSMLPDGTSRLHKDGKDLFSFSGIATMAETVIAHASSAVKVPDDAPLDKAALLGCAVMTGVGAVFNTAKVPPGSSVAVFGAGGVGLNVIQGAAIAGAEKIIAVDVQPKKLALAKTFGATHTIDSSKDDAVTAIKEITDGRGSDFAFEAIGIPEVIEQAYAACRKGGTCVVVGVGPFGASVNLNAFLIPLLEKSIVGSWYGGANPHRDIPNLLALYRAGKLLLDELVTRTYKIGEINEAFSDMQSGVNARGVIVF